MVKADYISCCDVHYVFAATPRRGAIGIVTLVVSAAHLVSDRTFGVDLGTPSLIDRRVLYVPDSYGLSSPDLFIRWVDDEVGSGVPSSSYVHISDDGADMNIHAHEVRVSFEDANMITEQHAYADAFMQFAAMSTWREPGYDGLDAPVPFDNVPDDAEESSYEDFDTPDPFKWTDDEVAAGERNAHEEYVSFEDANMITEQQACAVAFMQYAAMSTWREPGCDGLDAPDPFEIVPDDAEEPSYDDFDTPDPSTRGLTMKSLLASTMHMQCMHEPDSNGLSSPDLFIMWVDDEVGSDVPSSSYVHIFDDGADMNTHQQAYADSLKQHAANTEKKDPGEPISAMDFAFNIVLNMQTLMMGCMPRAIATCVTQKLHVYPFNGALYGSANITSVVSFFYPICPTILVEAVRTLKEGGVILDMERASRMLRSLPQQYARSRSIEAQRQYITLMKQHARSSMLTLD